VSASVSAQMTSQGRTPVWGRGPKTRSVGPRSDVLRRGRTESPHTKDKAFHQIGQRRPFGPGAPKPGGGPRFPMLRRGGGRSPPETTTKASTKSAAAARLGPGPQTRRVEGHNVPDLLGGAEYGVILVTGQASTKSVSAAVWGRGPTRRLGARPDCFFFFPAGRMDGDSGNKTSSHQIAGRVCGQRELCHCLCADLRTSDSGGKRAGSVGSSRRLRTIVTRPQILERDAGCPVEPVVSGGGRTTRLAFAADPRTASTLAPTMPGTRTRHPRS